MKIDCISDLHGYFPSLDGGDLLIVAGDLTGRDTIDQWGDFFEWLSRQRYTKKIFIAGNHDGLLEHCDPRVKAKEVCGVDFINHGIEYLQDSGTEFNGYKIWGSPWTSWFEGLNPNCAAFTKKTEYELYQQWKLIPRDTDILITHNPPHGILDTVRDYHTRKEKNIGSLTLLQGLEEIQPKLHVFGHIHEHGGKTVLLKGWMGDKNTQCMNVAWCNEMYEPTNKPQRYILPEINNEHRATKNMLDLPSTI